MNDLLSCESIRNLDSVADHAGAAGTPADRAYEVFKAAHASMPATHQQVLDVYFGLLDDWAPLNISDRNKQIGTLLSIAPTTWASDNETILLNELATAIKQADRDAVRIERQQYLVQSALESRLHVDWLARSSFYSRCETVLDALRTDLFAALQTGRGEGRRANYEDYVRSSLFWVTTANALDEERRERFGGWILTRPIDETHASTSYTACCFGKTDFTQREFSWLRRQLYASDHRELDGFCELLEAGDTGNRLLEKWRQWISACKCPPDSERGVSSCRLHELTWQVTVFSGAVRRHWNDLTDWYPADQHTATDVPSF